MYCIYIYVYIHIYIYIELHIYIYNGHICNMSNYMSTCSQDVSHYQYQSLPCFMGPISPVWLLVPGSIKQPSFRSAGAFHVPKPLQPNSSPPDESSGASSWWPWKFEQICHFWWYHPVEYKNTCQPGLLTYIAELEHRSRTISSQQYNRSIGLICIPRTTGAATARLVG